MGDLVTYVPDGPLAIITMDDGKANVLSPTMQAELDAALDRAEADTSVVVLRGREGVFSGGFDLAILRAGGPPASSMLRGGFDLAERMLTFPRPIITVCTGHAVAMGVFLLLSGDYRIGGEGTYKLTANEVAIGLTMPRAAIEILRQRLTPAAFTRATLLAEVFSPADAVACGFLDQVVRTDGLESTVLELGQQLAQLDERAHAETKLRARRTMLEGLRIAIEADRPDFDVSV